VLKFLLLSIILLTFIVPAYAARGKDPRRALLSALLTMAVVEVGYAFFLLVIYPRLL
jgi:cyanate permease